MPMASVTLLPTVDVEKTYSLNEAGISQSQMIRFKDNLIQTYGGWVQYTNIISPSTVRDIHPWQDIPGVSHLGVGATNNLFVITSGSAQDITPQTFTSNPIPNFSTVASSFTVTVVDAAFNTTVYDTVFFNTPVAVDNLLLNGAYKIVTPGVGSYTITSSVAALAGVVASGVVPAFYSSGGSPVVTVGLPNHNFQPIVGLSQSFRVPTTVDGLTVSGPYNITSVINSSTFTITSNIPATANASASMNSTRAQLIYYVTQGPPVTGTGFGFGGFGTGGFGGTGTVVGSTGVPITTTDWSLDNWGELLVACPKNGAIYTWSPESGFANASVVPTAPFFNGGIFISMPQQILVAWKSVQSTGTQDNLVVRWSDAADYTNWAVTNQTTAGSFHIPTGSVIIGGLQAPNFGVIWTDIDVWIMQYVGGTVIFNFTRMGTGCGLIGQHAAAVIAGSIYWCGTNNFFTLTANGVQAIPCTVWDFIFQNMNLANASKIKCAPNSVFNEITWFFPSVSATENDSYVKYNIVSKAWDYGSLSRTAWTDVSILGNPIGVDNVGFFYQHEIGNTITGAGLPNFRSGWWSITEGNDLAFVDYVLPDFKWGTYSGTQDAQINVTFFSADYPGDTPLADGPYTVTQATEYLTPRIRARLMSILVQSNSQSFWRLGRIRYRFALSGRR